MAKVRARVTCLALYTVPMPPVPRCSTISKRPAMTHPVRSTSSMGPIIPDGPGASRASRVESWNRELNICVKEARIGALANPGKELEMGSSHTYRQPPWVLALGCSGATDSTSVYAVGRKGTIFHRCEK